MKASPVTNDTVQLSGSPELWKVVASINGTKVDIQQMTDCNLEIIYCPTGLYSSCGTLQKSRHCSTLAQSNEPFESYKRFSCVRSLAARQLAKQPIANALPGRVADF